MAVRISRFLRGATGAILASYVGVALGVALLFIQFALLGLWLAAIAMIPFGVAGLIIARKVNVAAQRSAVSNVARPRGRGATQTTLKRLSPLAGRAAAGIADDPLRASKLFEAVHATNLDSASELDLHANLLGVVSEKLMGSIEDAGARVIPMMPSISSAQIERMQPQALVLDISAFERGPWSGALQASGVTLLEELSRSIVSAKDSGLEVVVVSSSSTKEHLGTATLRDLSTSLITAPSTELAVKELLDVLEK